MWYYISVIFIQIIECSDISDIYHYVWYCDITYLRYVATEHCVSETLLRKFVQYPDCVYVATNTPLIVQQTAPFQTINIKIYPVISWELIKRVDLGTKLRLNFQCNRRRTSSPKSVDSTNHGLLYHWTAGQHDVMKEYFGNFPMRNDRTCSRRNIFSSPRHRWSFKLKSHYKQTMCCLRVMGEKSRIAEIVIWTTCQRTRLRRL